MVRSPTDLIRDGYTAVYATGKRRRKGFGRVNFDGNLRLSRQGTKKCRDADAKSVERDALDTEAGAFESGDDGVDRLGVRGLALDLDDRVLCRKRGEDPAVTDLDDVGAGFVDLPGDRGERSGLILGGDAKPRDAALADEVADEDVGEQVRVDVPAAQQGCDLLAAEAARIGQHGRKAGGPCPLDDGFLDPD